MEDLAVLLKGSVDDVTKAIGDMSPDTLKQLRASEVDGKKRSTLLEAIDAAIAAKEAAAADDTGDGATAATFSQAQLDQALAEQKAKLDADADRRVQEATRAGDDRVQAAEAAWKASSENRNNVSDSAGAGELRRAGPIALVDGEELATLALDEGGKIVFTDRFDVPLPELPEMTFGADAFEPAGDNAVRLKREVSFPQGIAATAIEGAFLLDDEDDAIGRARLVGEVSIGGGRDVRMPAGALLFTRE